MTQPPVSAADAARLRDLVRRRIGISVAESRTSDLQRAVQLAAAEAGLGDPGALHELLTGRPGPGAHLDALVTGLNVGETHFFRDADQIKALRQHILPELIASRRRQRRLRVWSAGCSTGEEAYTLAMLIHGLVPDLPAWDVLVLGTDVNGRSLRRARRGVYRAWSLRGMPPSAQACYLRPHPEGLEVAEQIRSLVSFSRLNLTEDGYPSPATNTQAMDLILCRNVLLYFGDAEARTVVRRLRDALPDDGWLLLSGVEASLGAVDGLDRYDLAPAAFRRGPRPAPATESRPAPPRAPAAARTPTPTPIVAAPPTAPMLEPAAAPAPALVPAPPAEPTACARALRLWRDGQRRMALAVLVREADRDPLLPQVHYLYGLILLDGGRADDALAAFRRCTYADPGFVLGYLGQAAVFARSGQPRRAATALDHTAGLVADLEADLRLLDGDGPRVAEVRELVAAQRRLLDPGHRAEPGAAGHD